jgi:hypothetical protein
MEDDFEYLLVTIVLIYIYMEVIISIQQTSSSETDSSSTSQEIPCILWDPKVHHSVHSLPLFPITSQTNLVQNLPSCFFQIHFHIILSSMPRFSKWSLSLSLFYVCHMTPLSLSCYPF